MKKNQNRKSLYELLFTIVFPVLLLNKLSGQFDDNGPLIALLVALSFPIGYFLWDFAKTKHVSIISILGFVNILLTGGFALFQLNSHWFAIKEMSIPLLIGLGVFYTAFTEKPLVQMFLNNDEIIDTALLKQKLVELDTEKEYMKHLKTLTLYFAGTFLVSAILNYVLAVNIVTEISPEIGEVAMMKLRNEQIADLTWKSYIIILAPSFLMISFILWKANGILKKCTELGLEQILRK
ncbi:MAG: intracellular septation protein A [Bacteriovoracaceae bacterium]|jgi:intracellular septation protein A